MLKIIVASMCGLFVLSTLCAYAQQTANVIGVAVGAANGSLPGSSHSLIFTTTDGSTWVKQKAPPLNTGLTNVQWNGHQWMIVGDNAQGNVLISSDGIN